VSSLRQWILLPLDNQLASDIIVLGLLVSVVLNVIVNLVVLVLLFIGKLRAAAVPMWLLVVNLIFFIGQILLFYVNLHPH
jgi:hypothetical protein